MAEEQDVVYYLDCHHRACVDICAKALDIRNDNNSDSWKYDVAQRRDKQVHYAEMLSGTWLEVHGQHSPVEKLTPNTQYSVLFELYLKNDASGFNHPVTFQFVDQDGNEKEFKKQLSKGEKVKVPVGLFESVAGPRDVKVKMYLLHGDQKSGLVIHCVTITPADNV